MRAMSTIWLALGSGCLGVQGSGVQAEERRELEPFDAVQNATSVPVRVVEGDRAEILVRCDDNLLDLVVTEVGGGELRVRTPPATALHPEADCGVDLVVPDLSALRSSGSGPLVASGSFPRLSELSSSGSGRLEVEGALDGIRSVHSSGSGGLSAIGLSADEISVESSGSGNIRLSGEGGFADLSSTGSGGIDASSLSVEEADVRNSGSGAVSLTVSELASVRLSGSGNVHLFGGARVDADDSGSGNVVVD